jgi:hypothetical protein
MSDTSPKDAKADELIAFLDGSGPLDGVWFGEEHPTEPGRFWWRKYLPALSQVRKKALLEAADECERMMMYPGGRQESAAHNNVWEAASAIRKLAEE